MKPAHPQGRALDMEEVRLVSDLRVVHSKVMELSACVESLRKRYEVAQIRKYADAELLADDIANADKIYQFYVSLAEEERDPRR